LAKIDWRFPQSRRGERPTLRQDVTRRHPFRDTVTIRGCPEYRSARSKTLVLSRKTTG
jgi:hypothetical protein